MAKKAYWVAPKSVPTLPNSYAPPAVPNYSGFNQYTVSTGAELDTLLRGGTVVGSGPNNRITRPAIVWLDADVTYALGDTGRGIWLTSDANYGADDWLIIATDEIGSLAAEGTRIDADTETHLAKIESGNTSFALCIGPNVAKVRLIGLEITFDGAYNCSSGIVGTSRLRDTDPDVNTVATSAEERATDIVIDRCWVHGPLAPNLTTLCRAGIECHATRMAVIESEVSHIRYTDESHAVYFREPCSQVTLWNNRLSGTGMSIMTGGESLAYTGEYDDLDIRYNHLDRDTEYDPDHVDWCGYGGTLALKNVIETKHGRRILIEKNYFNYPLWSPSYGHGDAIKLKLVNQNDDTPAIQLMDVTIRWNDFRNVYNAISLLPATDNAKEVSDYGWIAINDNLIVANRGTGSPYPYVIRPFCCQRTGAWSWNSDGHFHPHNITIENNTVVGRCVDAASSANFQQWLDPLVTGGIGWSLFNFNNNIIDHGTYGIKMTGTAGGQTTLNAGMTDWNYDDNVYYGPNAYVVGAGSIAVASIDSVGFSQWADPLGSWKVTGAYSGYGVDYDALQTNLAIALSGVRF